MRGENDSAEKGSVFTVILPFAATPEPTVRAARELRRNRPAARALIVEDDVDASDTLREILEFGGHVVEVAHSGPEALGKALAFKPDIVLCDIGLPGMDGYAVARALRADPALGHVAVVALSGYAEPEDVARAQDAGFAAYLVKPPNIEALLHLLERLESDRAVAP